MFNLTYNAVTPEFLQEIEENDSETPVNKTAVKRCSRISTFFRKFTTEYVAEAQAQDPYCRKISAKLAQLPDHQDASFRFHHGLLLRKKDPAVPWVEDNCAIVVPRALYSLVLAYFHSLGHLGGKRLHKLLSIYYWFPKARTWCIEFAQGCHICQSLNRHKTGAQETTNMEEVTRPNQVWAIDFMSVGRTGRLRDILNIIDEYSGFLVSFPCSSQKTPQVIRALQTCFSILGVPEAIRRDHGRSLLEARAVKTICMAWGVKQFKLGIPNIPTKNACV